LGASVAFVVSMAFTDFLLPLPESILAATPPTGFFSLGNATLFNAVVNAGILLWAARRSSLRGTMLWLQLAALSFGAQTFQTQIETGYFLPAFPLLVGNWVLHQLVVRGLVVSLLFTLAVTALAGGFSKQPRRQGAFTVSAAKSLQAGAWLGAVYYALYALFGYFVAWQYQEVRLFYGGPAELNSFWDQWALTLMTMPEIPFFQYFRGLLWLLCLIPVFMGFSGKRSELVVFSSLALALLPTAQLAFPNPLMPAGVSLAHFWEVSISTGLFGALCAWYVPQPSLQAATKVRKLSLV
jgi:hypothetical protein